jgi:hypothetical protein
MKNIIKIVSGGLLLVAATGLQADQQILDDLIVDGSICVGMDCVNGESFGFDTIRLKENNLRIRAVDTSSTSSFPTRDWQITFNDSSNGGANKFSIDDIDGGRTPLTIEANAPSHSLYVDDGGRLGLGTSTPVVDVHVKSGNTPTLRLEQDGSSGFTAQTWDVAGNEANFFIRDATNGSTLPFKVFPGAPNNALTIEATTGDIGMGTTSPAADLHVARSGFSFMRLENTATGVSWDQTHAGSGQYRLKNSADGDIEFDLDAAGNLIILGSLTAGATAETFPDYVFKDDYNLMSLPELENFILENNHLPGVPSAEEIGATGRVDMTEMQRKLLEKVEELTLYTLAQESTITSLVKRIEEMETVSRAEVQH